MSTHVRFNFGSPKPPRRLPYGDRVIHATLREFARAHLELKRDLVVDFFIDGHARFWLLSKDWPGPLAATPAF